MGDSIENSDINSDLLGKRISLFSPFFPSLPYHVTGVVTYIESSKKASKVVLQEDGKGQMIMVDFNMYKTKEIED
jgi:hypothetical protein